MPRRSASPQSSTVARVAAGGALLAAVVVVVLVLFGNGPSYTVHAEFQNASGLVPGDLVMVGPARVGSVSSIGLTPTGGAEVTLGLDSSAGQLPQGTIARIFEASLSGIANKYVVLEPGPSSAPSIPDGGVIPASDTYSAVSLDQLFDTLDPQTRAGLRNFIQGQATSIEGRALQANKTLEYLAPALDSTTRVTNEIARDETSFDDLLVQGAQALQALSSRSVELTQLVANANVATGAIASQSQALQQALRQLPPTLNQSVVTFAGLRRTLDALDPVVAASIPANRQLEPFAVALRTLTLASIPTIGQLNGLIRNPAGTGDLTSLLGETPSLANLAASAFPRLIAAMNDTQNQVNYLREYAPDIVGALTNLGQTGAYYDANGHYARTQPFFNAFGVNAANELTMRPPSLRYEGLNVVRGRCPGSAVQSAPDGSAPWQVPGCELSATPPGP